VRIAFVVQRYGPEILGGAEQMCRLIAERLAEQHQIDVLTSCAKDFFTWKNEYPEGADRLRGVTVRRFACSQTRDIEAFGKYSAWIFSNPHGPQDEQEWLKRQGPWSPGLMDYVERHHSNYDILVLFTYLYAPTVMAARIAPAKTVLVPFAHDEPAIKLDIFRELFTRVGGIAWNTESERRFANSLFDLRPIVEDVIGCGVDLPEGEAVDSQERTVIAPPRSRRRRPTPASRCPRTSTARPTRSAAAIASTTRSCCSAAASIPPRAARSCSSTSRRTSRKAATRRSC
jgi:glycosyltransferase involved in cell wall biosynthesis